MIMMIMTLTSEYVKIFCCAKLKLVPFRVDSSALCFPLKPIPDFKSDKTKN